MRNFYLSNEWVTESDGSEAWAIIEKLDNKDDYLYQIGFKDKAEAEATLKRVIAKRRDTVWIK